MDILRFDEYNELITEAEIVNKKATKINLNNKKVKIKENIKYSFLGIEFIPIYNNSKNTNEPYRAIIRRPGSDNGTELYWGNVITAETMEELQNEIRVSIKFYIEDNPVIENNDNLDKSRDVLDKFGMDPYPLKVSSLKIGEKQKFKKPIEISREALDRFEFSYWNEYTKNTTVTHIKLNNEIIGNNTIQIYLFEEGDEEGYLLYTDTKDLQEFLDQQTVKDENV